jgi:acyl-coenzyme A synthetase/AMP-(fatty) acid ligase
MTTGGQGAAEIHSVIEAIARYAARAPDSIAYLDLQGSLSYGALHQAAARAAAWLSEAGVRPGDTVALALEAGPAAARRALDLLYGLGWIGAAALPLFPDTPVEARLGMIRRFAAARLLASGAPSEVAGARTLDPLLFDPQDAALDRHIPPRGDRGEAGFVYMFTSGTTGDSKALLSTHAQIVGKSRCAAQAIGLDSSDRLLPVAPWPASVGLRYLLRAHAVGAGFVCVWAGDTREELAQVLSRFGVTRMYVAPVRLRALLGGAAPVRRLATLRSLSVIGAAVSPAEIATGRAALTANLVVDYGCNEVGPIALLGPGDDPDTAGCVGRLLENVEARVDDESGQPLAPGAVGELGFRAPWMATGFADSTATTRELFRDGWFYPGDTGRIDAQGRVYLAGRSREVINCGGMKIWPEEIENVIRRHSLVADVAVTGLPHPVAGQVAAAFVVLRPSTVLRVGPRELHEFCLSQIEKVRVPPHFFIVTSIPRNPAGKIVREELASLYPAAAEAARSS